MADNTITICLTDSGLAILAASQLGVLTTEFTKLEIGDGELNDDTEAATLTALINPIMELEILSKTVTNDTVITIKANIEQGETSFYYREIGLYAYDAEGNEVLYAYGNKGESASYIPENSSTYAIEEEVELAVTVASAADVVVNIASSTVKMSEKCV